ncbi:ATP-grasp domain-containing protein [Paraburkholderia kururiensis]|uniref:ATP-grasp domain-containing protein n=1 Tax=Paraburkholderia kururiensis TaxID=984307 RepID=UPI0039A55F4A
MQHFEPANSATVHRYALIVDPLSSGRYYLDEFHKHGVECIGFLSSATIPEHLVAGVHDLPLAKLFDDKKDLLRWLSGRGEVIAVVAGFETAIEATDGLAAELGVTGNDVATSQTRRYKDEMQRALKDVGVRGIHTQVIATEAEKLDEIATRNEFPCVVKPVGSAGSEGVTLVRSAEELAAALDRAVLGSRNELGIVNDRFILQPYVSGTEYVVDLVAFGDQYHVAAVGRYEKVRANGGDFVYLGYEVLNPEDDEWEALTNYAKKAAAALNVSVGPLHMEIIVSPQGPVLVEAGARLHGGVSVSLFQECYDPNLLTTAVRSYMNLAAPEQGTQLIKHGKVVALVSSREGERPVLDRCFDECAELQSYKGHKCFIGTGGPLRKTVDLTTCPAVVWLAHHDPSVITADETRIRSIFEPVFGRLETAPNVV